eukprot:UN04544
MLQNVMYILQFHLLCLIFQLMKLPHNLFLNFDIRFNFQDPTNNGTSIPINVSHMLDAKNPNEFNPKYFHYGNYYDFRPYVQAGDFVPATSSAVSRLDANFPSYKYYSFTFMDIGLYDMRTAISPQSTPSCSLSHSTRVCRREPCDWRYDSGCPDVGYRTVCHTEETTDTDATIQTIGCTQNNCTTTVSRYYLSSYRTDPKLHCTGFGLYNIYVSDVTQNQHIYNDITYDYSLLHPGIPQSIAKHNKVLRNVLFKTKFENIYGLVDAKTLAMGTKDGSIKNYHSFTEFGTTFDDSQTSLGWVAIFFIVLLCIIFFSCFGCCAIICGHRRGYGPATRLHSFFAAAICFAFCFEFFRPKKRYDVLIDDTTTHHHHHHHHHVAPVAQPPHHVPLHPVPPHHPAPPHHVPPHHQHHVPPQPPHQHYPPQPSFPTLSTTTSFPTLSTTTWPPITSWLCTTNSAS